MNGKYSLYWMRCKKNVAIEMTNTYIQLDWTYKKKERKFSIHNYSLSAHCVCVWFLFQTVGLTA